MIKNRIMQAAAGSLELPPYILHDNFRIDMLGRNYLRIINHKGIMVYERTQISVRLADEILLVCGNDLEISQLDEDQLMVAGYINALSFKENTHEI